MNPKHDKKEWIVLGRAIVHNSLRYEPWSEAEWVTNCSALSEDLENTDVKDFEWFGKFLFGRGIDEIRFANLRRVVMSPRSLKWCMQVADWLYPTRNHYCIKHVPTDEVIPGELL